MNPFINSFEGTHGLSVRRAESEQRLNRGLIDSHEERNCRHF
jgi:hypothetical protein